jgi:hypothetical protein
MLSITYSLYKYGKCHIKDQDTVASRATLKSYTFTNHFLTPLMELGRIARLGDVDANVSVQPSLNAITLRRTSVARPRASSSRARARNALPQMA